MAIKAGPHLRLPLSVFALVAFMPPHTLYAQTKTAPATSAASQRSGQHDFDFEFGTWKTQLKRRLRPLTGSDEWAEYTGTSIISKIWNGHANMVELDVQGPAGRIEGASWRLYNPETRQWSLNFANKRGGALTSPVYGRFENGRGMFYGTDTLGGRTILVRFVITEVGADTAHFEQAYSDDGGETWEINWIADDTRIR